MKKYKLQKVYINDSSKDGKKFITKDGKPFKKIAIQVEELPNIWLSSLIFKEGDQRLELKEGDEVYLKIWQTEDGGYWNFELPTKLDLLEERIITLEKFLLHENNPS